MQTSHLVQGFDTWSPLTLPSSLIAICTHVFLERTFISSQNPSRNLAHLCAQQWHASSRVKPNSCQHECCPMMVLAKAP
jgi:hypothetical protein